MINKVINILLLISMSGVTLAQTWQSKIVFKGYNNKLEYVKDSEGNKIPDFSGAGYKGGGIDLPYVPVVKTIEAVSGDNTLHIQSAINEISKMPFTGDGFRGALLLKAGKYEVNGTIRINESGIVLRGEGQGADPKTSTIIYGKGNVPHQRTIIIAGGISANATQGSKWKEQISGTKTDIISDTIFVGDKVFEVQDASKYSIGDNIIIYHPCTDGWLKSINYGGAHSGESGSDAEDVPWKVDAWPIVFNRYIKSINGNAITIDAPVFNTLIRSLSQAYIYKYARTSLKTNIGIENLRVDIETAGGLDENHAWQAIDLFQIEDSWVRDCTMLHFGQSGVRCNTASRITVRECSALDPVSKIDGERRYNFNAYTASQQILFEKCVATNGRHHYVSNGTSWVSGIVFLDCTSSGAYTSSEGHRSWSMGLLYDNLIELDGPRAGLNPRLLGLYNRGHYGTSHGWAAAHSVAWNCDLAKGDLIVQKPPTAQNYAIGCSGGRITGKYPTAPFNEPEGYIEGINTKNILPRSLYLAQLEERLTATGVEYEPEHKPLNFRLNNNYPNPFNPETIIEFAIPSLTNVSLKVYDLLGNEITTMVNESRVPGNYIEKFDSARFDLTSGVYLYTLQTDSGIITKKMVLVK